MPYIETNGYFTFDGVKSSDYGVWINGGGTYNAPKRRYKTYEVPGRNGNLTIDEGAFEELEVIYPAFIARDFPSNIEAFRNELMSRNGYVRMTDSYHPGEYYLARYMDGLEAEVAPGGVGGAFNLKFMRDPRRFLVSGDTAIPYPPGQTASKNLIPYPYYNTTHTTGGITFTDNGDGTVTADGIRTGTANFILAYSQTSYPLSLPKGEYILTGCPTGGGSSTYRIQLQKAPRTSTSYTTVGYDTGDGLAFTVDDETANYRIMLYVYSGYADNLTFMPMVRNKYGINYITYPFYNTTKTTSDITYTDNGDGTITADGTATSTAYFSARSSSEVFTLPKGNYRLTGCPEGGSTSTYRMALTRYIGTTSTTSYDVGNGYEFTVTDEHAYYSIVVQISSGITAEGLVFRPMIQSTEESNDEWEQYHSATQILNPTKYTARPLIRVTGYGTLTIGSDVVTIASGQTYVDIDSEIQDCYTGTENKNDKVSFQNNDFPTFPPGVTGIAYSGNITQVDVTPRWWRI